MPLELWDEQRDTRDEGTHDMESQNVLVQSEEEKIKEVERLKRERLRKQELKQQSKQQCEQAQTEF